jgi:mRNA interferase MazF
LSCCPFRKQICRRAKRRPARVAVDLPGDDLILCQITSRAHQDTFSVAVAATDFQSGQLHVHSYIRPNRLFTVEQSVVLYTAARLTRAKLEETLSRIRQIFS